MLHDLNQKNLHINVLFFLQNSKNPIFLVFMRSSWEVSKWATLEEKKVYLLTYWHTDSAEIIGTVFFYRFGSNNLATKTFLELLEFQESWNVIVQD